MYKQMETDRMQISNDLHSHDIIHFTSKLPNTVATDSFGQICSLVVREHKAWHLM